MPGRSKRRPVKEAKTIIKIKVESVIRLDAK